MDYMHFYQLNYSLGKSTVIQSSSSVSVTTMAILRLVLISHISTGGTSLGDIGQADL